MLEISWRKRWSFRRGGSFELRVEADQTGKESLEFDLRGGGLCLWVPSGRLWELSSGLKGAVEVGRKPLGIKENLGGSALELVFEVDAFSLKRKMDYEDGR